MKPPKVALYVWVRLPNGKRTYLKPFIAKNGKLKKSCAILDGEPHHFDPAIFYLTYDNGEKRVLERISTEPEKAIAAKTDLEIRLQAEARGIALAEPVAAAVPTGRPTSDAVAAYLEEIKLIKKKSTYAAYSVALRYFGESCKKKRLEEIDRTDMLRFTAFVRREKGDGDRTVANQFLNVMIFWKWAGIRTGVNPQDWPKYTEEDPEIYEQADLDKLFAVCDPQERLYFEFFLMTGLRSQEVTHTYWSDIDLGTTPTVKVTAKAAYQWTPKRYKARQIPIPTCLAESLRAAKVNAKPGCPLLFPSDEGKPNGEFLALLKKRATDAGLNPDDCWLHKFRATYATWHLWAGRDLLTVGRWLGHSPKDLRSTMRYLRPARGADAQRMVNETFPMATGVAA